MTVTRESGLRAELGSAARPLLERKRELAALHAAIEAARSGEGRLVVIEGTAGMGKTRLLGEARSIASGFEVLSARAGELESDFAFGIVRQLFEGPVGAAPDDTRAELFSGAAALAAGLFALIPNEPEPAGAETSFAMLHGLYWLAANFALRQPTLIVVDDLHWADQPSLRWLGYLAKRLDGLPMLVLVATRPPEQSRAPALVTEIVSDSLATVIRPAPLGQESAVKLAEVLFGLQPDEGFAAALRDASGGNPLYLAAILDAVAHQQIAPTAEQAPRLLELGGEALAGGVSMRLSRLPDQAVALARAGAIFGDQTELALAAALANLDTTTALDAASALVHSGLLQHENPLEFMHPVVRSALLEDMSAGARMRLHRRAAEILLNSGAWPEQAATYLMATLPTGDQFVVAALRHAAQRSLPGSAEAAIAYLRRALEEPPEPEVRGEVLAELGIAEMQAFASDDAAAHLQLGLADLDDIASRPDLVLAYVTALSAHADSTRTAFELLEQLTDRIRHEPGLRQRLEAHLVIAAHYDPALYPGAGRRWDALRDAADSIEAGILLAAGAYEEARRGAKRPLAVELGRRALASDLVGAGDQLYLVDALWALLMAGHSEEAVAAIDDAVEVARHVGDRLTAAVFQNMGGRIRFERGELLAAEEALSAPEVISYSHLPLPFAYRTAFLADVLLARGEIQTAEVLLAKTRLDELLIGHRVQCLSTMGRLHIESGRPVEGLADLQTAGAIANSIGIENPAYCQWRSQAALALQRLARIDEALALARVELELSRRWGAPRAVGISLQALGLIEGGSTGEGLLREAVDVLADSPARLEYARALIDLGAALRRANSRSEARKRLREGIDLAHQCGATALVDRGNEELAATGAHPRKVMLIGLESLTASERRVAQMAAEEVSNKEIAQALFVTVKTVEVHLSRAYRKLDITSRRELAGALSAPAVETRATA